MLEDHTQRMRTSRSSKGEIKTSDPNPQKERSLPPNKNLPYFRCVLGIRGVGSGVGYRGVGGVGDHTVLRTIRRESPTRDRGREGGGALGGRGGGRPSPSPPSRGCTPRPPCPPPNCPPLAATPGRPRGPVRFVDGMDWETVIVWIH